MTYKPPNIILKKLGLNEPVPYTLLLLADPSREMVDGYMPHSAVYVAVHKEEVIGVAVLLPLTSESIEIKNIAVKPDYQRRGVGGYLLEQMNDIARRDGFASIRIATANSSIGQLYLYQKTGFEISEIMHNYFIENYDEAIFENGIQAKHLLVLTRQLQ